MSIDIFNNFYKGKRVLVTGHTGFKGSWLSIWLHELGAEVVGVAKDPYSEKDNYVLSGIGKKIKAPDFTTMSLEEIEKWANQYSDSSLTTKIHSRELL